MIRIGLLLEGTMIQAWQAEAIRQIIKGGHAEIALLIFNSSPRTSGDPSPFFYRVYRKFDRLLFKGNQDAFVSTSISSVLNPLPECLEVQPIQKKYRDIFSIETIEKIQGYDLDIILRLGFRILSGEILTAAKYGVWSYHHGDPRVYRGGPPAFWEVMKAMPITSAALLRITEKLDQGEILYQSFTQTNPLSVQRNANRLFWQSSFFVARVIAEVHRLGWKKWENGHKNDSSAANPPLLKPPRNWVMLGLFWSLVWRNLSRKIHEFFKKPHWSIALFKGALEGKEVLIKSEALEVWDHPDSKNFYWADPFPISHGGKEYILVEEFDKRTQKGRIVCLEKAGDKILSYPVLNDPWHLSYPFVWEENGMFYLIPESAGSGKIYCYKALEFPFRWEKKSLFFYQEAYDPTLFKWDGVYWLFVNQKAHSECSPFDELHLYFSDNLENPSWQAHPQNPIVSDVRKSRPAGRLFSKNGMLYRPAQDSGLRYGHRVRIQKIQVLSKEEYRETTVQTLESGSGLVQGIHTFNQGHDGVWIDLYHRK